MILVEIERATKLLFELPVVFDILFFTLRVKREKNMGTFGSAFSQNIVSLQYFMFKLKMI